MVAKGCIIILFFILTSSVSAQQLNYKLSDTQINEIFQLSEQTKGLSKEISEIEKIKANCSSLSSFTIAEIKNILNVIEPSELKSAKLSESIKEHIDNFSNQFYQSRKADFDLEIKKRNVSNSLIAIENIKGLVRNEIYILLSKKMLILDGKTHTKVDILKKINGVDNYQFLLNILNQNIDEKAWDRKSNFVYNHLEQRLFR